MPSRRPPKKGIACIESFWDTHVESRLSVAPLLQVIASSNRVRFIHLTCNTKGELEFALKSIPSRAPFKILYFAFHGSEGKIDLADGSSLSLPELASTMGRKFSSWVFHFGTCGTINTDSRELSRFMRGTGASLLLGYKKDVDWIDSAAMDLILFDWMQSYKNMRAMWSYLKGNYRGLMARTGLTVFPRG